MTDQPKPTHRMIGDTMVRERDGIVAKCTCGWVSRPYFSGMSATVAFRDHQREAKEARAQP